MNTVDNLNFESNVALSALSTFGIGGPAKKLIRVKNSEEFLEVLKYLFTTKQKFAVFAGGSNTVFPDRGLNCILIKIDGEELRSEGEVLIADAGVKLQEAINKSISAGLSGLEYLSGIPGTVGGAVVGNAGAYGHSISEAVAKVEVYDGEKKIILENNDCMFLYRDSIFKKKKLYVLRVYFSLKKGNAVRLAELSGEIISQREKKYRPGTACPGSFFKNVLVKNITRESLEKIDKSKIIDGKIPAGYLLDEIGARGTGVGGIIIADFHGNLFINKGGGTAKDVRYLAEKLKSKVRERFGILLEEEIRYF